jgi:preprotein translocase subunit SecD
VAPPKKTVPRPGRALAVLVGLIVVMLIGIVGKNAFSPANWRHDFKVQLGLDLSSGTSVTLQATTLSGKAPPAAYMKEAISVMTARVNGAGFSGAQIQQQGNSNIVVTVPGKGSQQVVNLVGQTALLFFRQVLLAGTATATSTSAGAPTSTPSTAPTPAPSSTPKVKASPSSGASSTSSPHAAGLPGPAGQPGGRSLASSSRLLAAAKPKPGTSATPKATGTPATSPSPTPITTAPAASQVSGSPAAVHANVLKLFNKINCNDPNWKKQIGYTTAIYDNKALQTVSCAPASGNLPALKYVLAPAQVSGTDVTSAQAGVPNSQQNLNTGAWQVNVSFNGRGTAAFGALTSHLASTYYATASTNPNNATLDEVAIVLDGQVVSAPEIQGAIPGGTAQITGSFTRAQATQLANELNYGALPVNLTKQNVQSVTPQLGRNQLDAGLIAAAIGLGLVVLYSFLYYRGLGLISVSSLIIAAVLAYFSVVLLSKYAASGFSLSLASIAGLIVAIGITADSFVVFFERLRDEVREGKSLRPAVESGWKRARRTILVSDTVSFLAALLLWYFSVSDVKGFAFTLGLTTLIDVIVVFLFTKPMLTILAKTRFFSSGHRLSGLDPTRLGARTPWRSGVPRTGTRRPVKEA